MCVARSVLHCHLLLAFVRCGYLNAIFLSVVGVVVMIIMNELLANQSRSAFLSAESQSRAEKAVPKPYSK